MRDLEFRSTTVIAVRRDGRVAVAGDGQVTHGATVLKQGAVKIRRMYGDRVISGFAGSSSDALALFGKFEEKIEEHHGNMQRAVIELARLWRTDKILRSLEAMLIVSDKDHTFLVSGSGDVVEPDDGLTAIGSGGPFALAAARALLQNTDLGAEEIARKALEIAASICVYTNENISIETL